MIIGVCAQGGIFNKDVIEALATNCEKPIVFPLSNPTEKAEANPHDVLNWTNEKAIVGTGTAFPKYQSKDGLKRIDQVNNSYIFPGIGLGAIVVGASKITDRMFLIAAEELAKFSPVKSESNYNFLPPLTEVRNIARNIAFKVAKEAVNSGLTSHESISDECINSMLDDYIWNPVYLPYKYTHSI
jgi:malate dehydrogenase (oxaloacetate-decarboxylating)